MTIIEKQIVKHYHNTRIQETGFNHANIQGWTNLKEQQARFNAILKSADFNHSSILDIGCGYGDFKARLDESCTNFVYTGIDQQSAFIEYAQQKYKEHPNTCFHEVDFSNCKLPKVDLVIASGVLSYYSSDQYYYFDMIQKFYNVSEKVLIFNMLDNKTFESGELLVAHDKEDIYEKCKTLCENTSLISGYLVNDFTIKMERK